MNTASHCGVVPVLTWRSPFGPEARGRWSLACPLCGLEEASWIGETALRRAWNFRVTRRRAVDQEADEARALDGAKERGT